MNLTHRVVARALGGEVMITRAVADAIGSSEYLELEPIGKVGLKGFPEPIDLFTVKARPLRIVPEFPACPSRIRPTPRRTIHS